MLALKRACSFQSITYSFPSSQEPAKMTVTLPSANVIAAGAFREEVRSAVMRWLGSGEHNGYFSAPNGAVVFSSSKGQRKDNQDRTLFLNLLPQSQDWPFVSALILCDGMGGMVDGAMAAELSIGSFVSALSATKSTSLYDNVRNAVQAANDDVYRQLSGKGGATLSVIALSSTGEQVSANVGDSRIYGLLADGCLIQLTEDDSLGHYLTDSSSSDLPGRASELLQFVGMGKGIMPHIEDLASHGQFRCLFLTSDGAHGIDEIVFSEIVRNATSPSYIAKRLTALAEWTGGKDNATVAAWDWNSDLHPNELVSRGFLEMWGLSGKYELISRKQVARHPRSAVAAESRRTTRRKVDTNNRFRVVSPQSNASASKPESVVDGTGVPKISDSNNYRSPSAADSQLEIEVLDD